MQKIYEMSPRDFPKPRATASIHSCINDKGPGEREIMERHEDESLDILTNMIARKK